MDELGCIGADFIIKSMENKSLLITGSTGYLGKLFMEEVLRIQPQVKKLYLLMRAQDTNSAQKRFQQQVLGKEVFSVLREKHGEGFNNFISSKVVPLAGDVSMRNLGIKDSELEAEMLKEIDFIVNVAATTSWDERYDVALSINTLGAKHVCEFSKKCQKLELLLHVSSAYAMRERKGLVFEKPKKMEQVLNRSSKTLNIELEFKIAQDQLRQLCQLEEPTEKTITNCMKDLGMQRSKFHGWLNTYVFTKAMGEMLLGQLREKSIPVVIIRPTLITSTRKQPFPGWIEGFKGIDALVQNYAKGELTHFVADPDTIVDVIPGDMVVNAMLVAMAAHRTSPLQPHRPPQEEVIIYNVCSSSRNPIRFSHLANWAYEYFSKNPLLDVNEKPIRVPRLTLFPSMDSFSKYATLHYKLPLEALRVVNDSSVNKSFEDAFSNLNKKYTFLIRLLELFEPLVFYKSIFGDSNLQKLAAAIKEEKGHNNDFEFDSKSIDWEDYFMNVHFPGSTKYASSTRLLETKSRL